MNLRSPRAPRASRVALALLASALGCGAIAPQAETSTLEASDLALRFDSEFYGDLRAAVRPDAVRTDPHFGTESVSLGPSFHARPPGPYEQGASVVLHADGVAWMDGDVLLTSGVADVKNPAARLLFDSLTREVDEERRDPSNDEVTRATRGGHIRCTRTGADERASVYRCVLHGWSATGHVVRAAARRAP